MLKVLNRPTKQWNLGLVHIPLGTTTPPNQKSSARGTQAKQSIPRLGKVGMADRMSYGGGLQEAGKVVGLKACAYTEGVG